MFDQLYAIDGDREHCYLPQHSCLYRNTRVPDACKLVQCIRVRNWKKQKNKKNYTDNKSHSKLRRSQLVAKSKAHSTPRLIWDVPPNIAN